MPFKPNKITREHVLQAVIEIEDNNINLTPSTQWDVIINDVAYPPKDILRYAHKQMNGELLWEGTSGVATNTYLDKMGFLMRAKNKNADVIRELIEEYKRTIDDAEYRNPQEKWIAVQKNLQKPDLDAPNFQDEMKSLEYGNFLFAYALADVRDLVRDAPEKYKSCLKALFDERIDLTERVQGFINDTNDLFKELYPDSKRKSHHDERTIATFLTFKYPEKYTFFMDTFYQKFCPLMGVKAKAKKGEKYGHYVKYINEFTSQYLSQEHELISRVDKAIPDDGYPDDNHWLLAQDIIFRSFWKDPKKDSNNDEEEIDNTDVENNDSSLPITSFISSPLNSILFGPPGTGKTYDSINLAVEIADPGFMKSQEDVHDRSKITKRYRELVDEGRIVFTTFHQSMSYEDFIEGIKPLLRTDQDCQMQYEIVPGIFKRICDLAVAQVEQILTTKELCQTHNSLGSNEELSDIDAHLEKTGLGNKLPSRDAVFDRAYEKIVSDIKNSIDKGQIYYFDTKQGAKHRAISVLPDNNIRIERENAPSMKPYAVRQDILKALFMHFPNMDDITIKAHDDYIRYELGKGANNGPTNIAILLRLARVAKVILREPIHNDRINSSANEVPFNAPIVSDDHTVPSYIAKNYVIIIDEINRGNVSQIFGELITLIEPDKRAGNKEALEITLPYSKEKFSVPSNLYIIGTMNTADRSVEALDTALRRRFNFKEKTPDYELLAEYEDKYQYEYHGISLSTLLETINKRIEGLLDEDHAIGHSYFLRVISGETNLKQVFFNEIIPLLQEYFYGNYSRIELVIGTGFVKAVQVQQSDYAMPSSDNEEFNDHMRYTLVKESQMNDFDFLSALRTLMNESDEA